MFDIPSNVYDERKVDQWLKAVIEEGGKYDKWIIFSLPDVSLEISVSAASNLCDLLPQLRVYGCLGILMCATHTNAKIFHHAIKSTPPTFDIIVSESMEYLCQKAEEVLGEQGKLNIFHGKSS
nr:hypothetical protein [Alteromonas sp. ASW11-130]